MVILIGNGAVGRSVGAGRKTGAANRAGQLEQLVRMDHFPMRRFALLLLWR
jgi:hypothetical protein